MDVSVVIVNYNTEKLLVDCIRSIYEKTKDIDYEIIVSDNNSSDNSINVIKSEFPNLKIVQNSENLGFGKANNEGFKIAQGKYLFCLNPDTLLVNNAIKILYDFMEQNPLSGAAGGNLFDKNMNWVHSFGYGDDIKSLLLRKTFLKFFYWKEYKKIKSYEKNIDRTKINEVNHITGADLMLRKSVIDEVGGFCDKFFMYFEETELEFRIKNKGYKLYFVPDAKIIHLEGKSSNPKKNEFYTNSFVQYYRQCYSDAWGEIAELLIAKRKKGNK